MWGCTVYGTYVAEKDYQKYISTLHGMCTYEPGTAKVGPGAGRGDKRAKRACMAAILALDS